MTSRRTRTIVPYSAEEMFDLVADIEKYPEFIPHCIGLRVVSNEVASGAGLILADMIVAYGAFRERFRTEVELDREGSRIAANYVEGPFRRLHNLWRFRDLDEGSEIDFLIDFQLRSVLLQATASAMFEAVFARMTDAFVRRAAAIYR
jgi:coenzyme Q-binding protein COQ10